MAKRASIAAGRQRRPASKAGLPRATAPKPQARRSAPAKERDSGETEAVLAAAKSLAAAVRAGSAAAAEKFLAREFSFVDAAGKTHPRAAVLKNLKATPHSGGARMTARSYGRVAVITGAIKSAQARQRHDLFALDIWVKGDDGWRALLHHDNVLAHPDAPATHAAPAPRPADAPPPLCPNPCELVPYPPKSQAEREIIATFQMLEQAVTRNDAAEWARHMADEFVVYRTQQHPTDKAARVAMMDRLRAANAETYVAEVVRMKLWVYGDAAVMRADHAMPSNRRPPYRATRVWVKRDNRWQMAVSQQTAIAE